MKSSNHKRSYHVILIKPSHYDNDGYVIRWRRTHIPANTLFCVRGIMEDTARRKVLGQGVDIVVEDFDDHCNAVPSDLLIKSIRNFKGGIVMMVGIQTNQFPRSVDLARSFRKAGIPVIIGGFHVSGCIAMTPDWGPGLEAARALGISLFAGELEGHADVLLRDAYEGRLKELYNTLGEPPDLKTAPMPHISQPSIRRTSLPVAGLDLGRGCPFKCSFCTIINVQGRNMRCRSVEKMVDYVRHCASIGINHYLISDDNFSRNKERDAFLDAFIELREKEKIPIDLFLQVDTQATNIPGFVEKAKRAGCARVFIGVESVRRENLNAVSKRQINAEDLREIILAWKQAGILTYMALIIGFPEDTVKSIEEDMRFIKENIATDFIYLFVLTPLPGSEDHRRLLESGAFLEPDLNRYDTEHPVTPHSNISPDEMSDLYWRVWDIFYAPEHIEIIFKRAAATGVPVWEIFINIHGFCSAIKYDKVHPLQGGLFRRKVRKDRRPGMPIESWWSFYPRRTWETISIQAKTAALGWQLWRIMKKAVREVEENGYSDTAIANYSAENPQAKKGKK